MVNITLDTGSIQHDELKDAFNQYENLIFDLDDTVFSEEVFDYHAFKSIALRFYLMSEIDADLYSKNGIIEKRKSRTNLFNRISPVSNLSNIDLIVDYYQNFKCGDILKDYSIISIIKEMYMNGKKIYVVSNGHPARQNNKIENLGINKYLTKTYICHPLTENKLKPSGDVLDKIGIARGSKKSLIIGDNEEIDGGFAKSRLLDFYLFRFPKIEF